MNTDMVVMLLENKTENVEVKKKITLELLKQQQPPFSVHFPRTTR